MELWAGASTLEKLPIELIHNVIDFIDPASHLNFACSCKLLAACSANVLQRHKLAFERFRVASDKDPSTIPNLLRSVVGLTDPIAAWNVRSVEIWCNRKSWVDWKSFDLTQGAFSRNEQPIKWHFEPAESRHYLMSMQEHLSEDEIERARTELMNGCDGYVKMLLIALCPRLIDLKTVTRANDTGSCLGWLSISILRHVSSYDSDSDSNSDSNSDEDEDESEDEDEEDIVDSRISWPSGFQALRSVALGVPSKTQLGRDDTGTGPHFLTRLLRLPRIESIYCTNLSFDEDEVGLSLENEEGSYDLPANCSTVKHIFLDNASNLPYDFRIPLLRASRKLHTLSFRGSSDLIDDVDHIVEMVTTKYEDSLRGIMFYEPRLLHGYRCSVYPPDDLHSDHQSIVCICVDDVELAASGEASRENDNNLTRDFFVDFLCERLPLNLECLVMFGEGDFYGDITRDELFEYLDYTVVALVESDLRPDLKAIHLESLEEVERFPTTHPYWDHRERPDIHHYQIGEARTEFLFQRAVAAGNQAGIDVHTGWNRNPMKHKIDFPEAPDEYDLVSGLFGGIRPSDLVFNPNTGRREPRGCGKCGACDFCLYLYPREVWETLED